VEIHVRGVKSTQPGFFTGKKRYVQVCVQVRVLARLLLVRVLAAHCGGRGWPSRKLG
jgi:hypothetical protein